MRNRTTLVRIDFNLDLRIRDLIDEITRRDQQGGQGRRSEWIRDAIRERLERDGHLKGQDSNEEGVG